MSTVNVFMLRIEKKKKKRKLWNCHKRKISYEDLLIY